MREYMAVPTDIITGGYSQSRVLDALSTLEKTANRIPLEIANKHVTKHDLVDSLDVKFNYDFALPQTYVDLIKQKMGYDCVPDFIWNADADCLFPITYKGQCIFPIILFVLSR